MPNKVDYKASISSSPVGSYGPSLTSIMTVPDSRARTVCHWPMGMFRATTGPPGESSMASKPPFRRISGADEWAEDCVFKGAFLRRMMLDARG